jgi:hypothetical protein
VLTLAGDRLTVTVLEPQADEERLGSRYVAGGYVWQVTDAERGELLAGPCFPSPTPPPFDGQGAPEVFEIALGQDSARVGDEVYVIGVGRVRRESPVKPFHVRDNPRVTERASWLLTEPGPGVVEFRTRAAFGDFALELARSLSLRGRTLRSATVLTNVGARAIPVRWFAHPFFPWAGERWCRLSLESALPEGAPLVEDKEGYVARRSGSDWRRGHYVVPRVALGGRLAVEQAHPTLGVVRASCDFPLGGLALWGNEHTCSFEPFLHTIVAPGHDARWAVVYDF